MTYEVVSTWITENFPTILPVLIILVYVYGIRMVTWMAHKDKDVNGTHEMGDFYFFAWLLSPLVLTLALIYTIVVSTYKVITYGIK